MRPLYSNSPSASREDGADEASVVKKEYHGLLHKCVVEGMRNVLGEGGMKAILFHHKLLKCIANPKMFHDKLYSVFGKGAVVIERTIVKELFQGLNAKYEDGEVLEFERLVNLGWTYFSETHRRRRLFD